MGCLPAGCGAAWPFLAGLSRSRILAGRAPSWGGGVANVLTIRPFCLCMLDIETIDSELRLLAALRRAARERGGPLPSIDVAGIALLDERLAS